jgi:hypothetical protein
MFTITDEWLVTHATTEMGWTKAQLAVMGIAWPPVKGWKRSLIGKQITDDEKRRFESAKKKPFGHQIQNQLL